ncbi:MAG TPA: type II secretion system F family protein [Candidatus Moranbacteria bacterium]|nr:type II secretion system F family protein [Candidatus Moranbacteria bacterium]
MKFVFKAKDKTGNLREGTIEAASNEAALSVLQKNGLFPVSIAEEKEGDSFKKIILKYYDRVTSKELAIFFRQLAILIEARVPIVASITAISEQTVNLYFKKILKEAINDIDDGLALSDALAKHGDVFSTLSINIIKAGETSGNLKKSVEYVADNIEKNNALTSRVRSALMYPAIVLVVFFIIGFIAVSFLIPKLTAIIKELNADVPWYTQIVITVGDFMSMYWWAVAIVILGFFGGILYYIKTEAGKKEWDQIKIRLPIAGVIFRYVYITRFAENLAVLLTGGIPILRALTVVSSVINNTVYEAIILRTAEEVKVGGNMSDVLKRSPLIPPVVSHMIKIGEESGQIDTVLNHVAKFYDQETEMMTKNLSTLIEPVLMVIIGIAVGFMAFAILMPIYNIAGQIK